MSGNVSVTKFILNLNQLFVFVEYTLLSFALNISQFIAFFNLFNALVDNLPLCSLLDRLFIFSLNAFDL